MRAYRDLIEAAEAAGWDIGENCDVLQAARDEYAEAQAAIEPFAIAALAYPKGSQAIVAHTPSADKPNYYLAARDLHRIGALGDKA